MLEDFSYDYIDKVLKEDFNVMERKELFEFFNKTAFEPLPLQEKEFPQRLEIDAGQFVSASLKEKCKGLPKRKAFVAKCNEIEIELNICYSTESEDKIQEFLKIVTGIVSFMDHCSHNEKINKLTLSFYLLDDKKEVGSASILGPNEVNGGATIMTDNPSIIMWRKEEICKVLIHELVHAFAYDHSREGDTPDITKHYQEKYNVSSQTLNIFEAYTEIWAELIHCYFLANYILKKRNLDITEYDLFRTFIQIEREFSLEQCHRVLHLHSGELTKDMNKETNVLPYYVIVGEFYDNLQDFLEFCQKHNKHFINIQNLELYFRYLKELKEMVKKNTIGKMKTGRMTICQLKLF